MLQDYNNYVKEIKMIEKKKALCYNKIKIHEKLCTKIQMKGEFFNEV